MPTDITVHDYIKDVYSIAKDIFNAALAECDNLDDIYDHLASTDAVSEAVDGSQWVIYTHRAMLVVTQYSDNEHEGPDQCGGWDAFSNGVHGWGDLFTRGAYYAMHADVSQAVDALIEDARD